MLLFGHKGTHTHTGDPHTVSLPLFLQVERRRRRRRKKPSSFSILPLTLQAKICVVSPLSAECEKMLHAKKGERSEPRAAATTFHVRLIFKNNPSQVMFWSAGHTRYPRLGVVGGTPPAPGTNPAPHTLLWGSSVKGARPLCPISL